MYKRPAGGRQQGAATGVTAGGSALSHRPDAMPGTTLYVPGSMCVPPAVHTALTRRDPGACLVPRPAERAAAEAAEAAAAASGASHYRSAFQVDPQHDYSVDHWAHRGAAAAPATASMGLAEADRLPPTTYQAELLLREQRRGSGQHGGARGGSASAPVSPAQRPGWLTTAQASQLPVAERYAAAAASHSAGSSPTAAAATAAAAAPAVWGEEGAQGARSASACRAALTGGQGAAACLTERPLLARSDTAAAARGGARCSSAAPSSPRLPPKEAALMYALDQHSRGWVPGYTGHRPQHGPNVALEPPPPSCETAWGAASAQALALRCPEPPPDASHAIDSRKGLLSFFSASASGAGGGRGGEFVSENGLAEAARYHESVRPLEGRMRIPQPSRVAPRGTKFTG